MADFLRTSHEEALQHITRNLGHHGLQIVRSFDVRASGATCEGRSCRTGSDADCQCQFTVLLVYGLGHPPATLIAHRRAGQTWFSLVNTPQQPAAPEVEAVITAVLAQAQGARPQPTAPRHD